MSQRTAQVESMLRRAVAQVLATKIADPRIEGMVSLTRVQAAPDLKSAQIFVSIMPAQFERKTLAGLRHAAGHIQRLAQQHMTMRTFPRLEFRLDESLKKQDAVEQAILDGLDRTRETANGSHEDPTP